MGEIQVTAERSVGAPVERVFGAWVSQEERGKWLLNDGFRQETANRSADDTGRGSIVEMVAGKWLRYFWEVPGAPADTKHEEVLIEFSSDGEDSTSVKLTHSRVRNGEDESAVQDGWEYALDSLKSYLESGSPIEFEDWESRKEMGL